MHIHDQTGPRKIILQDTTPNCKHSPQRAPRGSGHSTLHHKTNGRQVTALARSSKPMQDEGHAPRMSVRRPLPHPALARALRPTSEMLPISANHTPAQISNHLQPKQSLPMQKQATDHKDRPQILTYETPMTAPHLPDNTNDATRGKPTQHIRIIPRRKHAHTTYQHSSTKVMFCDKLVVFVLCVALVLGPAGCLGAYVRCISEAILILNLIHRNTQHHTSP